MVKYLLPSQEQDLSKMKALAQLLHYPFLKKKDIFEKIHSLPWQVVKNKGSITHSLKFPLIHGEEILFEATFEQGLKRPALSKFKWSYKTPLANTPTVLQNKSWAAPFFSNQNAIKNEKLENLKKRQEEFLKNKNEILYLQKIITNKLIGNPLEEKKIHTFYENLKTNKDAFSYLNKLFSKVHTSIAYKPVASLTKWWEINKEELLKKTKEERSQSIEEYMHLSQKWHFHTIEPSVEPKTRPLFKALFDRLATPYASSIKNQMHQFFSIQKRKYTEFENLLASIAFLQEEMLHNNQSSLCEELKQELFLLSVYEERQNHIDNVLKSNF